MAHHESEMSDEIKKYLAGLQDEPGEPPIAQLMHQLAEQERLGATGQFPEGKLTENDEGEIAFAVGIYGGKVVVNFGKPIMSLGMNVEQARQFANLLRKRANEIKKGHA